MKQFDALRQTGSIEEYYNRFIELSHHILLYNPAYDHVFFVTRFLHGLKDEIRAVIVLHRPKDVETASALALLQESELEQERKKTSFRNDKSSSTKPYQKPGYSVDKGKLKGDAKFSEDSKPQDKLDFLKAYH